MKKVNQIVLILIVVEDGLVLRSDNGEHMLIMVLILIVVEDGLVLIMHEQGTNSNAMS